MQKGSNVALFFRLCSQTDITSTLLGMKELHQKFRTLETNIMPATYLKVVILSIEGKETSNPIYTGIGNIVEMMMISKGSADSPIYIMNP